MVDLLKENYIVGFSINANQYVFYKVLRTNVFNLIYNFNTMQNMNPMNPAGANYSAYSPYYNVITSFPIPSTLINTNITTLFKIDKKNEIWQVFMGLSPSYLRVIPIQPSSYAPKFHLDQSINPNKNYYEIGFDGFDSPFNSPSDISETYIMDGLDLGMVLINPVTVPISPVINFTINRMLVMPITDPTLVKSILDGRIPAHLVTIGSAIDQSVASVIKWDNYPGTTIFTITNNGSVKVGGA